MLTYQTAVVLSITPMTVGMMLGSLHALLNTGCVPRLQEIEDYICSLVGELRAAQRLGPAGN